jgi:hypothetical protein
MKATSLRLGLSLAAASVIYPASAFAQAPAPAAAAPAPAPAAPAAEAAPAAAPAPAPAAEPAPAPAAAPAPEAAPAAAPAADAAAAPAAEPPPPAPAVTGYVDAAYHLDINHNSITKPAQLRAYDANGGFILHAAHLAVAHSFSSEASAFVSVDFGSDATVDNANYSAANVPVDIREGYLKWTPGDFTFQAGKFVTLNGIEVVDGPLNPTITRGFLFWLAEPVGHTGAKMQYALGGGMAHIGVGLVNGWDRLYDNNNKKTFLFNADVAPSSTFHAQISGSYGPEGPTDKNGRLTVDLTGAAVFDALTLNFQGLVGSEPNAGLDGKTDTWFGLGLQPVYTMDKFSLGARLEYFNDKGGSRLADGTYKDSLLNFTITPGYTPTKNIMFRAEFRIDAALAAKDPATDQDAKKIFNGKSTQPTIALGATYSF